MQDKFSTIVFLGRKTPYNLKLIEFILLTENTKHTLLTDLSDDLSEAECVNLYIDLKKHFSKDTIYCYMPSGYTIEQLTSSAKKVDIELDSDFISYEETKNLIKSPTSKDEVNPE